MFGFGKKGTVEIQLPALQFQRGGTISGSAILALKKQVKAKGLFVKLYATQRRRESTMRNGRRQTSYVTRTVFDFTQPLEQEREFTAGERIERKFSIVVPAGSTDKAPEGVLGTVVKTLEALSPDQPVQWYLKAYLDIPWGIDISKKMQLNIG